MSKSGIDTDHSRTTIPQAPPTMTDPNGWRPRKGDRVTWRGQPGVIDDDYWAHRDRYTVRFDDGSESDFGAECLRLAPPAQEDRL